MSIHADMIFLFVAIQVACVGSNTDFTDAANKFDQQLEVSLRYPPRGPESSVAELDPGRYLADPDLTEKNQPDLDGTFHTRIQNQTNICFSQVIVFSFFIFKRTTYLSIMSKIEDLNPQHCPKSYHYKACVQFEECLHALMLFLLILKAPQNFDFDFWKTLLHTQIACIFYCKVALPYSYVIFFQGNLKTSRAQTCCQARPLRCTSMPTSTRQWI